MNDQHVKPEGATGTENLHTMLIVDDIDEIRNVLAAAMDGCPDGRWHVELEGDSSRALELVQRRSFDVVLSDFRMGNVDGLEVLAAAATLNPEGHRVLMTGFNEIPADQERLAAARLSAQLQKPFRTRVLYEVIRALFTGAGDVHVPPSDGAAPTGGTA